MEEALFIKYKNTSQAQQDSRPSLAPNDQSEDANIVRAYKTEAVQGFVDLYQPNLSDDEYKKAMIRYANHNVQEFATIIKKQREHAIFFQNITKNIFQMNVELKKQINFLEKEAQINKTKRELKEERALKRKNAITKG